MDEKLEQEFDDFEQSKCDEMYFEWMSEMYEQQIWEF